MNERQALLDAILEDPDDDLARLVFADWLQENGEEDFAEYIRIEIEWTKSGPGDGLDWFAYTEEQRSLWHRRERIKKEKPWPTAHLPEWAREAERKRGFIRTIRTQPLQWIADGDSIVAIEPIECLIIDLDPEVPVPAETTDPDQPCSPIHPFHLEANRKIRRLESQCFCEQWLIELVGSTYFPSLQELSLRFGDWPETLNGFQIFAQSRICEKLRVLDLSTYGLDEGVAQVLAASPHLTQLRELNLASYGIGTEGAKAVAGSANFRYLEVLNFSAIDVYHDEPAIHDEGVQALAESTHLSRLRFLDLTNNELTDASATMIAESPVFANLGTLNMGTNSTTVTGLAKLLASTHLGSLKELAISLKLPDVYMPDVMFAGLDGLPSLETLNLWGSDLTSSQLIELMGSPVIGRLKKLRFYGNQQMEFPNREAVEFGSEIHSSLESLELNYLSVGDGGVATIARIVWHRLTSLKLSLCQISALGSRLLALSSNLSTLRFLSLSSNPIGSEGAIALADSPHFPALRHLKLEDCGIDDDALQSLLASPLFHSLHSLELHENSLSDDAKERLRREFPSADFRF